MGIHKMHVKLFPDMMRSTSYTLIGLHVEFHGLSFSQGEDHAEA